MTDSDWNELQAGDVEIDEGVLDGQREHWSGSYEPGVERFGSAPSEPALAAASLFAAEGAHDLLELGAGQGRDSLLFARRGLAVTALDYADGAVSELRAKARTAGLAGLVSVAQHDVRQGLPCDDASFDACYSHMLYCMALTTAELEALTAEVRRVLRPGGLEVYTARTVDDAHYRTGIARGDDMFEVGGFIVHFFSRDLVERLATGWELLDVAGFEEGALPRRLVRVTMRRPLA